MLKKISNKTLNKVKQFLVYLNKEDTEGMETFLQLAGIIFVMGTIAGIFIAGGLYFGISIMTSVF